VPFFAVLAYLVVIRVTHSFGGWLLHTGRIDEASALLGLSMGGARTMLETIITLNLSSILTSCRRTILKPLASWKTPFLGKPVTIWSQIKTRG
jgi:hypothetical protein